MNNILVVDPAVKTAETECFHWISKLSSLPCRYYAPVLHGFEELQKETLTPAGIVLLGSRSSANENAPWQKTLEQWLTPHLLKRVPFFGICFGHQLVARWFGGRVEKFKDESYRREFRKVRMHREWQLGEPTAASLFASHGEVVTYVPSELEVAATSLEVEIEGLKHSSLPLWTLQCHPEAIPSFALQQGYEKITDEDDFAQGHALLREFLNWAAAQESE